MHMQIRQGELPKQGHFRPLNVVLPLALTVFFSLQLSCTSIKTDIKNKIEGDSTLFQTVPIAKTETPANIKLDSAIKLVALDVSKLEHYYPPLLIDDRDLSIRSWPIYHDIQKMPENQAAYERLFLQMTQNEKSRSARLWRQIEDETLPFGLKKEVIDLYSPQEKQELLRRWECAKTELRAAFMSREQVAPSQVFQKFSQKEIERFESEWDSDKRAEKEVNIKKRFR